MRVFLLLFDGTAPAHTMAETCSAINEAAQQTRSEFSVFLLVRCASIGMPCVECRVRLSACAFTATGALRCVSALDPCRFEARRLARDGRVFQRASNSSRTSVSSRRPTSLYMDFVAGTTGRIVVEVPPGPGVLAPAQLPSTSSRGLQPTKSLWIGIIPPSDWRRARPSCTLIQPWLLL